MPDPLFLTHRENERCVSQVIPVKTPTWGSVWDSIDAFISEPLSFPSGVVLASDSFIHSFNKHLLSTYCVTGTGLSTTELTV